MPQSSLNVLIKESKVILKTVVGKGRNSKTGWTTVSLFMKHVLFELQQTKLNYKRFLQSIVEDHLADVVTSPACSIVHKLISKLEGTRAPLHIENYLDSSG